MLRVVSSAVLRSLPSASAHFTFANQCRFAAKKAAKNDTALEATDKKVVKVSRQRSKAVTKDSVQRRNAPHPSGCVIEFNPSIHRYTVKKGGPKGHQLKSVTGLLRSPLTDDEGIVLPAVTHPFDLEGVALRIAERDGKTVEEVKQEWEDIAIFGSKLHHFIFSNLTGEKLPNDVFWSEEELKETRPLAYQQAYLEYRELLEGFGYKMHTNGSEMIIASLKYDLAGTIDCLFYCAEGNVIDQKPHYLLVDWKTNKHKLRGQRPFPGSPQTLNWPFTNLQATKTSEYTLQTNCYRRILEIEGYLREPAPIKMAIAQFLQAPSGKVEVDGIAVQELNNKQIDSLFAASNTKKTREARKKLPFSV